MTETTITREDFHKALNKALGRTITFNPPITGGEDYDNFEFIKGDYKVFLDGVVVLFDKKKALDKQVERITDYVKKSFDNFKSLTKVAVSDQYKEWVEAQQPKLAVSKAVAGGSKKVNGSASVELYPKSE